MVPCLFQAYASKEVILSGGAINSPQLLMLSGIGNADDLKKLGIPVVCHLPGELSFRLLPTGGSGEASSFLLGVGEVALPKSATAFLPTAEGLWASLDTPITGPWVFIFLHPSPVRQPLWPFRVLPVNSRTEITTLV